MDGSEKTLSIFFICLAVVILFVVNCVYKYNVEAGKFPVPQKIGCPCTEGLRR